MKDLLTILEKGVLILLIQHLKMENEFLFFIPVGFFGLISMYCFYSMMSITALEYKDDGHFFGVKSANFIGDFRIYTKQLKDKKKIKKHNRLYFGFIISIILTVISIPISVILSGVLYNL